MDVQTGVVSPVAQPSWAYDYCTVGTVRHLIPFYQGLKYLEPKVFNSSFYHCPNPSRPPKWWVSLRPISFHLQDALNEPYGRPWHSAFSVSLLQPIRASRCHSLAVRCVAPSPTFGDSGRGPGSGLKEPEPGTDVRLVLNGISGGFWANKHSPQASLCRLPAYHQGVRLKQAMAAGCALALLNC